MDKQYEIVSNNDADRQGGMREAYITVRAEGLFPRLHTVAMAFSEWLDLFAG